MSLKRYRIPSSSALQAFEAAPGITARRVCHSKLPRRARDWRNKPLAQQFTACLVDGEV